MKKIFFILDKLTYGGGEILLIQLCKELKINNFDITIIIFDNDVNQRAYSELELIGITLKIEGKNNYYKLFKLYKIKKNFIVHSYALKANFFTRLIFSLNKKAFIVSHHHGNGNFLPKIPVILNRYTYFLSNINICVSYATLKSMYSSFLKHKSMKVIYNFTNTNIVSNYKQKIGFNEINLISINRLVPSKNVFEQIDAVKIIHEKGYNVKLNIIGSGPLYYELKLYIRKNLLNDKIQLIGEVSNSEITLYLDKSDIMIFTSKAEGLGIVPIEAMSRGIPVCAYDIDGLNEVIENNYNGKLSKVGDVSSLAENIISISTSTYKEFSLNAINTVKNKFNKEKILNEYLKVYRN